MFTSTITAQITKGQLYKNYSERKTPFNIQKNLDQIKKFTLKTFPEVPRVLQRLPIKLWWFLDVIFDEPDHELHNWFTMIHFDRLCRTFEEPDMLCIRFTDEDEDKTYSYAPFRMRTTPLISPTVINISGLETRGSYPIGVFYVNDAMVNQNHIGIRSLYGNTQTIPIGKHFGQGILWSSIGVYITNNDESWGTLVHNNVTPPVHGTKSYDYDQTVFNDRWILPGLEGALHSL